MKFLKYKFSAFFASYLGTELPKAPFPVPDHPMQLCGSTAGRFIRKMLRSDRALSFATGVLYLKKAMPRALDSELRAAVEKTKLVLTTSQPIPSFPASPLSFCDLLQECRRTVREIFRSPRGRVRFEKKDLHRPIAPSIRANFRSARSNLGTLGCLLADGYLEDSDPIDQEIVDLRDVDVHGPPTREEFETAHRAVVYPRFRDAVELDVKEVSLRGCGEDGVSECLCGGDVNDDSLPLRVTDSFRNDFSSAYAQLYERIRFEQQNEPFDVKLVPLAESLKIRVISKGPGYKYWLLKPIQVFLSKLLGRHRCFALTRDTDLDFTTSHLNEVFSGFEGDYHSLDYEGATDNFNPQVSEAICDELSKCMELDEDLARDFTSALTGHVIDGVPQRWGQLMGSVVSFVVLCIGNASVVRAAYEHTVHRSVSLSEAPITINGDDGGVKAPSEFLPLWKMFSATVGLKPSLGKVYSHPFYLNINSTSFWSSPSGLRHIPYVNMGLVCGLKRSSELVIADATSYDDRTATLGARHRALIKSCPPDLVHSVHVLFLKMHADLLSSSLLSLLPRYVSEDFGGLGLQPIPGGLWGPTWMDRDICDFLSSTSFSLLRRLPGDAPLAVRSLWTSALPFRPSPGCPSMDMTERDIGFLDVASFYVAGFRLQNGLHDPLLQLRKNATVWARLRRRFSRVPCPFGSLVVPDALD
jgi:hypothetical protein